MTLPQTWWQPGMIGATFSGAATSCCKFCAMAPGLPFFTGHASGGLVKRSWSQFPAVVAGLPSESGGRAGLDQSRLAAVVVAATVVEEAFGMRDLAELL